MIKLVKIMPKELTSSALLRELKKISRVKSHNIDIDMSSLYNTHSVISSLVRVVKDLENPFLGSSNSEFFLQGLNKSKEGKLILQELRKLTSADLYPDSDYEVCVRDFIRNNGRIINMIKKHQEVIQDVYNLSKNEAFKEIYNSYINAKLSEGLSFSSQELPQTRKGMMGLIFEKELSALKLKGVEVKNLEHFIKLFDAQMKPKLFDKEKAVSFIEKMFSTIEDLKTSKGTQHSDRKMTSKPESSKGFSK